MQRKFAGFDTGTGADSPQERLTGVPASFFTQLMPQISHPNELKTLLYFIHLAGQKKGEPKWVGYWELAESEELLKGLRRGGDPRPAQEHLREALELCLARGSILRVEATPPPPDFFGNAPLKGDLEPVTVTWFLLNTAQNRSFLHALEGGEIQIEHTSLLVGIDLWDKPLNLPDAAPEQKQSPGLPEIRKWRQQQRWRVRSSRPDIYTLYEQNIGPLTPILSEKLREAEMHYPPDWVADAFAEAVNYNRRNWAYIARILENWSINGRERIQPAADRSRTTGKARNGRYGGAPVAGDGETAPPAVPEPAPGASRPTAPNRGAGPIDFTKYTTGKYAHITRSSQAGIQE